MPAKTTMHTEWNNFTKICDMTWWEMYYFHENSTKFSNTKKWKLVKIDNLELPWIFFLFFISDMGRGPTTSYSRLTACKRWLGRVRKKFPSGESNRGPPSSNLTLYHAPTLENYIISSNRGTYIHRNARLPRQKEEKKKSYYRKTLSNFVSKNLLNFAKP